MLKVGKLFALSQVLVVFGCFIRPKNPEMCKDVNEGAVMVGQMLDFWMNNQDDNEMLVLADQLITGYAKLVMMEAVLHDLTHWDILSFMKLPQMRYFVRNAIEEAGYDVNEIYEGLADDIIDMSKKNGTYVAAGAAA